MSVVLVTATQNFIIFMSDGRVQHEENGIKFNIQEDYKKLLRINQNVCIGYTGNKDLCEKVIQELYNPYNPNSCSISFDNLNIEGILDILYNGAKKVFSESNCIYNDISFVIGGISTERCIEFYTFGSKYNFEIKRYMPSNGNVQYTILHSNNAKGNELEKHLLANAPLDGISIKKAMEDCIDEIAALDDSVNKNKFTEVIECDYFRHY